jgi:CheY-like chemotaxis protein
VATNPFYRKKHNTKRWHFCTNCTDWPAVDFEEEKIEDPPSEDICPQCIQKQTEGTCEQSTVSQSAAPQAPKKILIIDDQADVRRVLTITLRHLNYETCEAADSAAGITMSLAEKPDLILMDLSLPDATGLETAQRIKENPKTSDIPIVACSGWKSNEIVAQAAEAGIREFLIKPISTEQLAEVIEKLT